jgi:4-carboxymuconolactone decarboxylase
MKRIEDWGIDDLNDEQLEIYQEIVNGPRGNVVGPIRVWLNNPKFAKSAQAVGKYARYESSLPSALSELAIITTGRCWSSQFEWEQHAPLAEKNGIKREYIDKIANAIRPIFKKQDEQIIYDFAAEVNIKKNVSDSLYDRAYNLLGKSAVIDIVAICGYYNLISMTLNVFKIPAEGSRWILPEVKDFNKMLP